MRSTGASSALCLIVVALLLAAMQQHVLSAPQWEQVDEILKSGIADKAFPGCVAMVANKQGVMYMRTLGHFTYGEPAPASGNNPEMSLKTLFDLASITKVLATTSAVALLYQAGHIGLDQKISDPALLGDAFAVNGKRDITVHNCLLHNTGFPPDPVPGYNAAAFGCPESQKYHPDLSFSCQSRIFDSLLNQTLVNPIGATYLYSDLSMITMMYVVGKIAYTKGYVSQRDVLPGCPIGSNGQWQCFYEAYVRLYVLQKLGMAQSGFLPSVSTWADCAPAWNDTVYRHVEIQGFASDAIAYAMGGIAGNSGLFSNVDNIARILSSIMFTSDFLSRDVVKTFTTAYNLTQSSRALGWDTNDYKLGDHSCGSLSPKTYSHLGYTGTQVCNDPERQLFTILLTNRVYPTEANIKVRALRGVFNTAVQQAVDAAIP